VVVEGEESLEGAEEGGAGDAGDSAEE